jgi:hypothetical protein
MRTEERVARANPPDLTRWAELGARARLAEIESERQDIFRTFPALGREGAASKAQKPTRRQTREKTPPRQRPGMSAAQRKAVSDRMKRYWAQRAKEKQAAEGTSAQAEGEGATGGGDATPSRKRGGRKKTAGRRKARKSARRGTAA